MGIFNRVPEKASATPVSEPVVIDKNPHFAMAFDAATTAVAITDAEYNIIYANPAAVKMLSDAESEIRKGIPHFSVNKVVGENIDIFHKDPSFQRGILDRLSAPHRGELALGECVLEFWVSPMHDESGQRTGTICELYDLTEKLAVEREREERRQAERAAAEASARLDAALMATSTNIVIADSNNDIVFVNRELETMLQAKESELRKELPNFSASDLVGKNIDVFHKNPAHQQALVKSLSSAYSSDIEVAGNSFRLTASPVHDESGERIGTVVEWLDRTEEMAVNREIEEIVDGAVHGDLSRRISLDGKEGFFRNLSVGVNELIDVYQNVIDEVTGVVSGLAHGELDQRVSTQGKNGSFEHLAGGINELVGIFQTVIGEVNEVLGAMAAGDLTRKIDAPYEGAFNEIKLNANDAIDRLTEVVREIKDTAAIVSSGSDEIATGNTNLSQRTEEQAASLEETSSAMEEMTSTIQQNAGNSKQANNLAQSARDTAENGGRVVGHAVEAMQAINDSSKKISDIIGVIDEIAFQTNLLALNASVEAARAGDQGRGFAVVADEVRNLAGRSATAAKEIKDLIEDSSRKVEEGSSLVNQSGETLDEIVNAVKKVSDIVAEISTASEEQAAGIDEVNKAVIQMDELTQQNAALVEQAAAASESLGEQAEGLDRLMSFFKVSGDAAPGFERPRAPRVSAPSTPGFGSSHADPVPSSPAPRSAPAVDEDDEWAEF